MPETKTKEHTIDAKGESLGRVASAVAKTLQGKDDVSYQKHLVADVHVTVKNAGKLNLNYKALKNKKYIRYTGYPGGQRSMTLEELITKHGYGEVVRRAVRGMLPDNKLRPKILKNLTVEE